MVFKESLKKYIIGALQVSQDKPVQFLEAEPIHGGDINTTWKIRTTVGDYVLKLNQTGQGYDDLFQKEFNGLTKLAESHTVAVPVPLFQGNDGVDMLLLMPRIERHPVGKNFWQDFADDLACLHRCTQPRFGLSENNYIGTLPQDNTYKDSWADFYAQCRLDPLIRRCVEMKLLGPEVMAASERLYEALEDLLDDGPPSLLHGDLWGGNFISGPAGKPYLYDPAVYYGHREMDLAMSRLFGGFDRKFYWHYEEIYPLAPGWGERISLYQLYPLLVHAVLFGGGYVQQVRKMLMSY